MRVREVIILAVVDEIAVFVARTKVSNAVWGLLLRAKKLSDDGVHNVVLVSGGNGIRQQYPRHPSRRDVGVQWIGLVLNLRRRLHSIPHFLFYGWCGGGALLSVDVDFLFFELLVTGKAVD